MHFASLLTPACVIFLLSASLPSSAIAQPPAVERLYREGALLDMSASGVLSSQRNASGSSERTARASGIAESNTALLNEVRELQPVVLRKTIEFSIIRKKIELLELNAISEPSQKQKERLDQLPLEISGLKAMLQNESLASRIESIRENVVLNRDRIVEQAELAVLQSDQAPRADLQSDFLDEGLSLSVEQLAELDELETEKYLDLVQQIQKLKDDRFRLERSIERRQSLAYDSQISQAERNQAERERVDFVREYREVETEIKRVQIAIRRIVDATP